MRDSRPTGARLVEQSAKPTGQGANELSGPHVNAAFLCERVLIEQDSVASAIRIVDRMYFLVDEEGEPVAPHNVLTLFVNLKSGQARGSYDVAVELERPSGERVPVIKSNVLLEGEERGVNILLPVDFQPEGGAGLYWFDILFDSQPLTRIPLRVVYQSPPTVGQGPQGE